MKATSEGPSVGWCRNGNSPYHEVFFEVRFLTSWVQLLTHPLCFSIFFVKIIRIFRSLSIILAHMCYALLHKPAPPLCTIAQASPTPMHYYTSQPHPYALLHKPAPPLCTIARDSPTPMHYHTSQPHPYALQHKPAPPLCTTAQASCTIAQASPTPMHYCTSQPHLCALLHKPASPHADY